MKINKYDFITSAFVAAYESKNGIVKTGYDLSLIVNKSKNVIEYDENQKLVVTEDNYPSFVKLYKKIVNRMIVKANELLECETITYAAMYDMVKNCEVVMGDSLPYKNIISSFRVLYETILYSTREEDIRKLPDNNIEVCYKLGKIFNSKNRVVYSEAIKRGFAEVPAISTRVLL